MDVGELTNQLRTMPVEQVVNWMVQNLGHKSLKTCVRKITNERSSAPKKKISRNRKVVSSGNKKKKKIVSVKRKSV